MLDDSERLALSVKGTANTLNIGQTKVYQEIKEGRLKAVKFGKRTLIPVSSIKEWLNTLPQIGEGK